MTRVAPRLLLALALLAGATLALGACGGSSKPGYCTDRTALQQSVQGLTKLSPSQGLSALQSQLRTIQAEAQRLVSSAKSDFPSETAAIRTSFDAVATDVRALPSNPSASQLATLAGDASRAVTAVRSFFDATKSKCG